MKPLILVTVPHAYCGPAAPLTHACDPAAPPAAKLIADTFRGLGYRVVLMHGNTDRRVRDLNRQTATASAFHARARAYIARSPTGTVLIDTHSYPATQFTDIAHWAPYDIVLCAYDFNTTASTAVARRLNAAGIRTATETPARLPILRRYWMIQNFGPRCRLAIMPEFNEDAWRTRLAAPVRLAQAVHDHLSGSLLP